MKLPGQSIINLVELRTSMVWHHIYLLWKHWPHWPIGPGHGNGVSKSCAKAHKRIINNRDKNRSLHIWWYESMKSPGSSHTDQAEYRIGMLWEHFHFLQKHWLHWIAVYRYIKQIEILDFNDTKGILFLEDNGFQIFYWLPLLDWLTHLYGLQIIAYGTLYRRSVIRLISAQW